MAIIGLIPARSGSKGIPDKNIIDLNGKPLLAYTIEAAISSEKIDRVIVSTDSRDIAEISKKHGAEVPFLRPNELAGDTISDIPVMRNAIAWLKDYEDYDVTKLVYLRPTTPLKTKELIDDCIQKLSSNIFTSVRTVTEVSGKFHPYWMFKNKGEELVPFNSEINVKKYYQRQLLPPCFRLNGMVDVLLKDNIYSDNIWGEKMTYVTVTDEQSVDVDTPFDLELCKFIMNRMRK